MVIFEFSVFVCECGVLWCWFLVVVGVIVFGVVVIVVYLILYG